MATTVSASPVPFSMSNQTDGRNLVTTSGQINQSEHGNSSALNKTVITSGPYFDLVEGAVFGIMVYPLCVICVYIFLGLIGNSLVFYVFSMKWARNNSCVFIIALAILDLINCSVNMPIEIFILSKPISFDFDIFCKISRYLSYVTTASYSFVLVAVAFDRYLLVCRPFKRRTLDEFYAVKTCIAAVSLGLITQWPSVLIYGTFNYEIPLPGVHNETQIVVEARTCLVTNYHYYVDTTMTYAFQGFLFICHVIIYFALFVMYIIIGRRLYISSHSGIDSKGRKSRMLKDSLVSAITGSVCCGGKSKTVSVDALPYMRNKRPSNTGDVIDSKDAQNLNAQELSNGRTNRKRCAISRSLSNIHLQITAESRLQETAIDNTDDATERVPDKVNIRPFSHPGTNTKYQFSDVKPKATNISFPRSVSIDASHTFSTSEMVERPKPTGIKEISLKRNTYIMRVVTFTFMLSYLPFLIIVTLRYVNPDIPGKIGRTEQIIYHVFLRSYFFNSITRPFIYAIMNKDYRKSVMEIFRKS